MALGARRVAFRAFAADPFMRDVSLRIAVSAPLAVSGPVVPSIPCLATPRAFLAVSRPVMAFNAAPSTCASLTRQPQGCLLVPDPFVGGISPHTAARALSTVRRPVVPLMPTLGTGAAGPFVGDVPRLTAPRALLAVRRPVVPLISGPVTLNAPAAVPGVAE